MRIAHTGSNTRHPWPDGTFLQGGDTGLVLKPDGDYLTAFVEAFNENLNLFIRGEGRTVPEAEDNAWAQYERQTTCPGHVWEARGYLNGAGICKRCGRFQTGVFTPEQLGCYCKVCGAPTFQTRIGGDFYCEQHADDPDIQRLREQRLKDWRPGEAPVTGSTISDMLCRLLPVPPG